MSRIKQTYCAYRYRRPRKTSGARARHVPGMRLSRMYTAASARSASWRPSMARADRDSRMASPGRRIAAAIPRGSTPLLPRPACFLRRQSAARRRRFRCSSSDSMIAFSFLSSQKFSEILKCSVNFLLRSLLTHSPFLFQDCFKILTWLSVIGL